MEAESPINSINNKQDYSSLIKGSLEVSVFQGELRVSVTVLPSSG